MAGSNAVSHTPSPSKSRRAWSDVTSSSASQEHEGSNEKAVAPGDPGARSHREAGGRDGVPADARSRHAGRATLANVASRAGVLVVTGGAVRGRGVGAGAGGGVAGAGCPTDAEWGTGDGGDGRAARAQDARLALGAGTPVVAGDTVLRAVRLVGDERRVQHGAPAARVDEREVVDARGGARRQRGGELAVGDRGDVHERDARPVRHEGEGEIGADGRGGRRVEVCLHERCEAGTANGERRRRPGEHATGRDRLERRPGRLGAGAPGERDEDGQHGARAGHRANRHPTATWRPPVRRRAMRASSEPDA